MTKIAPFQLRKKIPLEEFDYVLLTSALAPYSGVRQKINELLKAGIIIRVKKGLYVFGPEYNQVPVCLETLANLIYGPSCISLEYALAYHGLIPERVETITSVTPKRDKAFDTPLGRFTYRYLAPDKYPRGIQQAWVDQNHYVLMACPEKALCDYILLNRIEGINNHERARQFLDEDLRIERDEWIHLNPDRVRYLNNYYRDANIAAIAEVL